MKKSVRRCHDCKSLRFKKGKLYRSRINLGMNQKTVDDSKKQCRVEEGTLLLFLGYEDGESWGPGTKYRRAKAGQRTNRIVEFICDDRVLSFTGSRCTYNFEKL